MLRLGYSAAVIAAMAMLFGISVVGSLSAAPDYEWTVTIVADAGAEGSNPELELGVHPDATEGYDSGLDIPHPPPYPGALFQAHFSIAHSLFPTLNRDLRGQIPSEWTLKVMSTDEAIELSWTAEGVPGDVGLRLVGPEVDINMKLAGRITLPAGSHALTIEAQPIGVAEYKLTISSTSGGGIATPGEGTFTYAEGSMIHVMAQADEGHRFVNWIGDVGTITDVNAAATTIAMDGDCSVTANFAATSKGVDRVLTGGIVAAVIVVGLLAFFLVRRKRKVE